ncbi:hypothetical protein Tco_0081324, partial [Tanacetum coccineum]
MKMEILLEPTSNKLMVGYGLSIDDEFLKLLTLSSCHKTTLASDTGSLLSCSENPVKKILLKLNLSDHRLCKMVMEVPDSSWLTRS